MNWKIYSIQTEDGRRYIGCTTQTIPNRMRGHRFEKPWLKKKKYSVVILAEADSREEASRIEAVKISEYGAADPAKGYNQRGGGFFGYRHSEKTKKAISKKAIGRKSSLKGQILLDAVRQRKNERRAGKGYLSGEAHPNYGKSWSPETRLRMSEGQTKRAQTEPNPMQGRKQSEEAKAKMRAYWKARRERKL